MEEKTIKGIREAWKQLTPEEREELKKFIKTHTVAVSIPLTLTGIGIPEEIFLIASLSSQPVIFANLIKRHKVLRKFGKLIEHNVGESLENILHRIRISLPVIEHRFMKKLHEVV